MTTQELGDRLLTERIVALTAEAWEQLADSFDEIERHSTQVAGDLLIIRTPAGPAAVEQPNPEQRVVRLLGDSTEVQQFVVERLSLYERMWDGCGCKVDYFS